MVAFQNFKSFLGSCHTLARISAESSRPKSKKNNNWEFEFRLNCKQRLTFRQRPASDNSNLSLLHIYCCDHTGLRYGRNLLPAPTIAMPHRHQTLSKPMHTHGENTTTRPEVLKLLYSTNLLSKTQTPILPRVLCRKKERRSDQAIGWIFAGWGTVVVTVEARGMTDSKRVRVLDAWETGA